MSGMDSATTGILQGINPDHLPALFELICLPLFIWLFLGAMRSISEARGGWAQCFMGAYGRSSLLTRCTALLLLATGTIHLGLAPTHLGEEPGTAVLFAIDGALFVALSIAVFVWPHWRPAAAMLLILTILAYLPYVAGGGEEPDQVGIATKLIELTALGLTLLPSHARSHGRVRRWFGAASAVVALMLLTGTVVWGASLSPRTHTEAHAGEHADAAPDMHGGAAMVMQPVPDQQPTPQEQAAAKELIAGTRAGIAKYEDLSAALADGYRASTPPKGATVHYLNPAYMKDGRILDPQRPESLVYANTDRGPELLGAMYVMPRPGMPGPDIGGRLTDWHSHPNLCFSIRTHAVVDFLSPFGTCPAGALNVPTAAMLHVWIVNNPDGPFGDLNPAFLLRLRRS